MSEAQELLPTEWIDRIRAAAADRTRLHIVGGAPHGFAATHPDQLNAIMLAFLKS